MNITRHLHVPHRIISLGLIILFCFTQTGFALPSMSNWAGEAQTSLKSTDSLAYFLRIPEVEGDAAKYLLRSGDFQLWFGEDAVWINYSAAENGDERGSTNADRSTNLKIVFPVTNSNPQIEPEGRQVSRFTVIKGTDPGSWLKNQEVFQAIRYREIYPGIDLVVEAVQSSKNNLPFHWRLEADGVFNWRTPHLQIEGTQEVEGILGGWLVSTLAGDFVLPALKRSSAWLDLVKGLFVQSPAFDVQPQAQTGLIYSTFIGGSQSDTAYDIAVGSDGSIFIAGSTPSLDFPTTPGAFDRRVAETDAFVAKFNPGDGGIDYLTVLGGRSLDRAYSLALDGDAVLLTGETLSADFPTSANAFDPECGSDGQCDSGDAGPQSDAFFARLSPDGSVLSYATYLGGQAEEAGYALAYEAPSAYLAGITYSEDFPASGYSGSADSFVVRFDELNTLGYATRLGGSAVDAAFGLQVRNGEAFLSGETSSPDFPGSGFRGGREAYIAKVDFAGNLAGSALLGGIGDERATDLALDPEGNALISGWTASADFPATYSAFAGGFSDGFLAAFTPSLQPRFVTFIGGSGLDEARSVAIDREGRILLSGFTDSPSFVTTSNAFQPRSAGGLDGFLIALDIRNPSSPQLSYGTLLGGTREDRIFAMVFAGDSQVCLTGNTGSNNFPTTSGALSTELKEPQDAFFTKLKVEPAPVQLPTSLPPPPTSTPTPSPTPALLPTTVPTSQEAIQTAINVGGTPLPSILSPTTSPLELLPTGASTQVLNAPATLTAPSSLQVTAGTSETPIVPKSTPSSGDSSAILPTEALEEDNAATTQAAMTTISSTEFSQPTETSSDRSKPSNIFGASIGVLVLLAVVILAIAIILRWRRRNP